MTVSINQVTAGSDDDLRPLLERACAGDDAAVVTLMTRFSTRVRVWAARFTDDADEAEDVAQDVLLVLGRRVREFDPRRSFATWLFAVTRNAALSIRRREMRRREIVAGMDRDEVHDDEATTTAGGDDSVKLNELVLSYFQALPPKQRMVFEMSDLRGMSSAAIAAELNMRPVTVRVHLRYARATIRRRLLENHEALVRDYKS